MKIHGYWLGSGSQRQAFALMVDGGAIWGYGPGYAPLRELLEGGLDRWAEVPLMPAVRVSEKDPRSVLAWLVQQQNQVEMGSIEGQPLVLGLVPEGAVS